MACRSRAAPAEAHLSFPAAELALGPRPRFNIGRNLQHPRYLGSLAVSHTSGAFWSDVLSSAYHGFSEPFTLLNATFGVRFQGGKLTTLLRGTNLLNQDVQQHVFGDILKRSVSAELRLEL